jgi:hypothetical protein
MPVARRRLCGPSPGTPPKIRLHATVLLGRYCGERHISAQKNISAKQNIANIGQRGRIEMAILIAGGAFFGAILGRIFKVFVLIPAVALAIASILVRREVAGHTWLDTFLGVGLLITSLALGYVTGHRRASDSPHRSDSGPSTDG